MSKTDVMLLLGAVFMFLSGFRKDKEMDSGNSESRARTSLTRRIKARERLSKNRMQMSVFFF